MHVNKIYYNNTADIPQAKLVRNLPGSLSVYLHDGFFQIAFATIAAAVHINHGHGLGMVDNQIPSAGQFHPAIRQRSQRVSQSKAGKHIFSAIPQSQHRILCAMHLGQ